MAQAHFPAGIDAATPNVARMYDYYLGGKDNFPADREAAESVLALAGPQLRVSARSNRQFLGRAVRHLADAGIRQFVDIGTGLPTQSNVHEVARQVDPGARVVYVDNDPVVLAHGQALLCGADGVEMIHGDLREPDAVLDHPKLRALVDFDEPVAVLALAILHFVTDDEDPAGIVGRFRDAMTPGSYLVVSHGTDDGRADDVPRASAVYSRTNASITPRSGHEILRLFDGFVLVEPGVVYVQEWGTGYELTNPEEMIIRAAIGCKI